MEKDKFKTIYKGLIIGGTMLVPGVSGGSMAMILGIYNELISLVSTFFKDKIKNIIFIIMFVISAGIGMFIFAKPLRSLIDSYTLPMMYFFIGTVTGGVPMIYRYAGIKKISIGSSVYVIIGSFLVLLLSYMPEDIFAVTDTLMGTRLIIQIATGFVAAIALVLPGISVSYMLLVMGLYDSTIEAISKLDIYFLMPMGVGLIIGIVSTTKILEKAMTNYPKSTYLIILGFILGSIIQVFPGLPKGYDFIICSVLLITGYNIIRFISNNE